MDLYINITDENGDLLGSVNIWQDGSDSGGAREICDWLEDNYSTEPTPAPELVEAHNENI